MSTVLITGGTGFIGSHTCLEIIEKGFNVLIIDSLINSKQSTFNKIKTIINKVPRDKEVKVFFKNIDLRNKSLLKDTFFEFKEKGMPINSVIHCAGLKSVEESILNPLDYWDINVNCTLNLIEIMNEFSCHTLVFSSSATIYKSNTNEKLKENHLKDPITPYGKTKLCIENILDDVFKSNPKKWRFASLRYFNPGGAHESGLLGEDPLKNANNIFPKIIKVLKKETKELLIYGDNWPTKDGTCVRDYIHIQDLAQAHLVTLKYLISNKPQNIHLNIGTGKGVSVLELVSIFETFKNFDLPYKFTSRRKGDVPYVVANNDLATKTLHWEPKKNIIDICKDICKWINKN